MTEKKILLEEILVGDKIKAQHNTTEDYAVFTVEHVDSTYAESAENVFYANVYTFYLVERKINIPTEPGVYSVREGDTPITSLRRLVLTSKGDWYWLDFTARYQDAVLEPVKDIQEIAEPGFYNHKITLVYGGAK